MHVGPLPVDREPVEVRGCESVWVGHTLLDWGIFEALRFEPFFPSQYGIQVLDGLALAVPMEAAGRHLAPLTDPQPGTTILLNLVLERALLEPQERTAIRQLLNCILHLAGIQPSFVPLQNLIRAASVLLGWLLAFLLRLLPHDPERDHARQHLGRHEFPLLRDARSHLKNG